MAIVLNRDQTSGKRRTILATYASIFRAKICLGNNMITSAIWC